MAFHKTRIAYRLALVSAFLAALFGAWRFGYSSGVAHGAQESYYCHVMHSERYLTTLGNLNSAKNAEVRSNLETGLSVGTVVLSSARPHMEDRPLRFTNDTLLRVKRYRETHPWSAHDEGFQRRVEEALTSIHEPNQPRP